MSQESPTLSTTERRRWFSPGLLALHVVAVVALVFTVLMGIWQLGVYDTRQADEQADRNTVPTVDVGEALGPDDAFDGSSNHRPVTATGRWGATDEQLWVSDREQDGGPGYWLVAPFVVGDSGSALPVVRGWTATLPADPADVPPLPAGTRTVGGVLEPSEASGTPLSPDRVTSTLRIPALVNEWPYDTYAGFAISTDAPPAGLETAATPDPEVAWTIGLRNLAYAVQWWVFGAFALFMWVRMGRDLTAPPAAPRAPADPPASRRQPVAH